MIVSASRRTDIPAFYSEWFMNRVRAGYARVRNPFNPRQVSTVSLAPQDVEAVVFWTKNPAPMMNRLDELDRILPRYYFLFTLNDYPPELEPNLPPLEERVDTFAGLAQRIGPERVVWRYDPIVLSNRTDGDYHRAAFGRLAAGLCGSTKRVIVSLVQHYRKTRRRMGALEKAGWVFGEQAATRTGTDDLLADLARTAAGCGLEMASCADDVDRSAMGIAPARCIDGALIERLFQRRVDPRKDPGQRPACNCAVSRDIGATDTCLHHCVYCYATVSEKAANNNHARHDPDGELLTPDRS